MAENDGTETTTGIDEDNLNGRTDDNNGLPGIVATLGELQPGSIITEAGIANLFQRHPASVKRAIQRGELPQPARLFGQNVWTVGVLIRHFEHRLERAARESEQMARRIAGHGP